MIKFPETTLTHRRIPKEAFYKHLNISTALKEKFISDVDRIFVENSFTMNSLRLTKDSEVSEILLLLITLKKKIFDGKIIEAIAEQNQHKLIFLLSFDEERRLAVFHGRLYQSLWMSESELSLSADGFSLKEIWDGFIEQIALTDEKAEQAAGLSIEQRLQLQEKIIALEKKIQKTEAAAWREIQHKKKFALYNKLQKYKNELEELKRGKAQDVHA